jgi:hypothetical protein
MESKITVVFLETFENKPVNSSREMQPEKKYTRAPVIIEWLFVPVG